MKCLCCGIECDSISCKMCNDIEMLNYSKEIQSRKKNIREQTWALLRSMGAAWFADYRDDKVFVKIWWIEPKFEFNGDNFFERVAAGKSGFTQEMREAIYELTGSYPYYCSTGSRYPGWRFQLPRYQ